MKATLKDLYKEKWLRARNSGELKWTMRTGKQISVKDMTDSHLENAINCIEEINEHNDIIASYFPIMFKD